MIDHLLNVVLTHERKGSRVSDGQGGYTFAWAEVGTPRARVSSPSGTDLTIAAQKQVKVTSTIYLSPAYADVRVDDRLRLGTRTFYVRATPVHPSAPAYNKVLAEEVVTA